MLAVQIYFEEGIEDRDKMRRVSKGIRKGLNLLYLVTKVNKLNDLLFKHAQVSYLVKFQILNEIFVLDFTDYYILLVPSKIAGQFLIILMEIVLKCFLAGEVPYGLKYLLIVDFIPFLHGKGIIPFRRISEEYGPLRLILLFLA